MTKDLFGSHLPPPHPGEILREDVLPRLELTRAEFAKRLGISPRVLADLLAARRGLTPEIAARLGLGLGTGARYWLGLQAQHDLWHAENDDAPRVRPIVWRKRAGQGHASVTA